MVGDSELKKECVRDVLGSVYVVLPCKGEQPRLGNEAKSGLYTRPIQVHAASLSSRDRRQARISFRRALIMENQQI